jgi:hypothetical protein
LLPVDSRQYAASARAAQGVGFAGRSIGHRLLPFARGTAEQLCRTRDDRLRQLRVIGPAGHGPAYRHGVSTSIPGEAGRMLYYEREL